MLEAATGNKPRMNYKAIYAYPWDLQEIGVNEAVRQFRSVGLDTVTVTGSYHAGKFLRPHGKSGKVYFPEDGTIYFKSDPNPLWRHQAGPEFDAGRGTRWAPRTLRSNRDGDQRLVGAAAQQPIGICAS